MLEHPCFERNLRVEAKHKQKQNWPERHGDTERTKIREVTVQQQARYWKAVEERDRSFDGRFVYAVQSTGVYCRPSCPSRRPRRDGVLFFPEPHAAESKGFRACLRC